VVALLLTVLALAAEPKTITLTCEQLKIQLINRDCNAGCLNAGDEFGWWSVKHKKCGCGRWEDPKELMEPKLYISFWKTYSKPEEETWEKPYTSYEPSKTATFLK
jgi:hypothetical protein